MPMTVPLPLPLEGVPSLEGMGRHPALSCFSDPPIPGPGVLLWLLFWQHQLPVALPTVQHVE